MTPNKMITVPEFQKRKLAKQKISMITCYDTSFARILNESPIDVLLIGDSSSMVMHGFDSTIHATVDMITAHVASVARGAPQKFIVADMPFLSNRKGIEHALNAADAFLKAGAHAIKIEGILGNESLITHITQSGIPVMGHLGLTPQFVNAFGGMKVQATTPEAKDRLLNESKLFEKCGAFSLVLECVPHDIAATITRGISIPTIGIGAGSDTDGQVLVLQDLLGFNPGFKPKFLRQYLNGFELFQNAFVQFHNDVTSGSFPSEKEHYS
jgi:3-methyl-2-oxobutanoate hydroxymethyltransferase